MLDLHALADQRHAPADQRQASSVNWHIVAIAKANLGLQVLCFASFAFAVQLSTFDFTKQICAVGRRRAARCACMGLGSFDRLDVWSADDLKQHFNAPTAWPQQQQAC